MSWSDITALPDAFTEGAVAIIGLAVFAIVLPLIVNVLQTIAGVGQQVANVQQQIASIPATVTAAQPYLPSVGASSGNATIPGVNIVLQGLGSLTGSTSANASIPAVTSNNPSTPVTAPVINIPVIQPASSTSAPTITNMS